jgi:hypothetical protein
VGCPAISAHSNVRSAIAPTVRASHAPPLNAWTPKATNTKAVATTFTKAGGTDPRATFTSVCTLEIFIVSALVLSALSHRHLRRPEHRLPSCGPLPSITINMTSPLATLQKLEPEANSTPAPKQCRRAPDDAPLTNSQPAQPDRYSLTLRP